jgi:hypothetical protein
MTPLGKNQVLHYMFLIWCSQFRAFSVIIGANNTHFSRHFLLLITVTDICTTMIFRFFEQRSGTNQGFKLMEDTLNICWVSLFKYCFVILFVTYTMLITKLNLIINGIKWSALLVFLVGFKINSEISLMWLALYTRIISVHSSNIWIFNGNASFFNVIS